jgi:hypothetical protein
MWIFFHTTTAKNPRLLRRKLSPCKFTMKYGQKAAVTGMPRSSAGGLAKRVHSLSATLD